VIDSPPEVVGFAPNLYEHLVQVPLPLGTASALADAPFPDLGREHRAEAVPPKPNRFVADFNAAPRPRRCVGNHQFRVRSFDLEERGPELIDNSRRWLVPAAN
jgi:hypothetical protein